jgi:hypothetical protein
MQHDDMMRERENERNKGRRMIAHLLANLLGGGSPTGEQMEALLPGGQQNQLMNMLGPAKQEFPGETNVRDRLFKNI